MGTSSKTLDKKCPKCDSFKIQYHKKSPWIDDFTDECPKCDPGEAMERLRSWASAAAREEEAYDNDHYDHDEEE